MRTLILILTLQASLTLPLLADTTPAAPPTDEQIKAVYDKSPQLIYEMVRKLWSIENTPVQLVMPNMQVLIATDFSAKVTWDALAKVQTGDGNYSNVFTFDLSKVMKGPIKVAYNPPAEPPWGWIIGGSAVVGVGVGVLATILLSRL